MTTSTAQGRPVHPVLMWSCFAMCLASLAVEVSTVRSFCRSLEIRNWPTTPGVVTFSERRTSTSTRQHFSAEIEYRYALNGHEYASRTVRPRGTGSDYQSLVDDDLANYPQGQAVLVYYDPAHSGDAFLEVGIDVIDIVIIISPVGFAALFGWTFVLGVRQRRRGEPARRGFSRS